MGDIANVNILVDSNQLNITGVGSNSNAHHDTGFSFQTTLTEAQYVLVSGKDVIEEPCEEIEVGLIQLGQDVVSNNGKNQPSVDLENMMLLGSVDLHLQDLMATEESTSQADEALASEDLANLSRQQKDRSLEVEDLESKIQIMAALMTPMMDQNQELKQALDTSLEIQQENDDFGLTETSFKNPHPILMLSTDGAVKGLEKAVEFHPSEDPSGESQDSNSAALLHSLKLIDKGETDAENPKDKSSSYEGQELIKIDKQFVAKEFGKDHQALEGSTEAAVNNLPKASMPESMMSKSFSQALKEFGTGNNLDQGLSLDNQGFALNNLNHQYGEGKGSVVENTLLTMQTPLFEPGFNEELQQKLFWMVQGDITGAQLQVTPAELGPIEVHLRMHGKEVELIFSSQKQETREALEAALPQLKESFTEQGMSLGYAGVFNGFTEGRGEKNDFQTTVRHANDGAKDDDSEMSVPGTNTPIGGEGLIDCYA